MTGGTPPYQLKAPAARRATGRKTCAQRRAYVASGITKRRLLKPPLLSHEFDFNTAHRRQSFQSAVWTETQRHLPPLFEMSQILNRHLERVPFGHRANRTVSTSAPTSDFSRSHIG